MTYAVIDVTSLVAGAVHRAMKLYSKPSLDSSGAGVRVTPPMPHLIVWGGDRRESQGYIRALRYVCDTEALFPSHLQAGAWRIMGKP